MRIKNFSSYKTSLYFNTIKKIKLLHKYAYFAKLKIGQVLEVLFWLPSKDGLKIKTLRGVFFNFNLNGLSSNFTLRNSYRSNSIESKFFIYSPLLVKINFLYWYRKKNRLARLLFIRSLRQRFFK